MACRHPCDDSGAIKVNFSCTATRNLSTLKKLHRRQIQGDQKFSVHLMVTIRKVTSNVQSDPRQSALTRRTLFSRNAFSTARSKLRMCSVMVIFRSSIAWGLFDYNESGAQRIFDHPVLRFYVSMRGRINCVRSPATGAGNVSEHRLMSPVGTVREVVCT